jgi:hypothetical protein
MATPDFSEFGYMSNSISLPDLPRALRKRGVLIPYNKLWQLVISGAVPAQRMGSRWEVRAADLPAIAEILIGKT